MAKPNFMSLVFATLFVSSLALFTICNASHESEVEDERSFTYVEGKGTGPKKWGHIDPHWKVCETGKLQSPIDLLNKRVHVLHSLGQLKRNYKPAPAIIRNRGHDISVEWKGDVGGLKINCSNYKLLQCHWHCPSEHTVNGRRYNMELHMVHQNAFGDIAVIGILYTYGRPDTFLAKMLNKMKAVNESGIGDFGIVNPWEIKFGSRKYYRYIGSLTTPPCTEGVLWTILRKVRTVSREQVQALRDAVHDGFEANARPTQQQHGRPLYFFNPKDQ